MQTMKRGVGEESSGVRAKGGGGGGMPGVQWLQALSRALRCVSLRPGTGQQSQQWDRKSHPLRLGRMRAAPGAGRVETRLAALSLAGQRT
ncbi:hypothetical protein AVEN_80677-1 [Araneus ventricosus]|uniref:Uncharacterized protein n=1 Tax=Araneus ventricosus TaxID=182803 RepID=A0A4Y2TWC7_ARAVE|nr:hypothetical protein AVEN_3199-1 [Araneus ventricosus]GBN97158.1 hypothetical protein AVEN_232652-1 [Araneus ventricosus]GBO03600.1 hypothetical protein AVEN_266538-1 [Araneus ventricosus]GBO03637.1 hypothetical protein AVEN_80677-1 [Araneus ventricosus]